MRELLQNGVGSHLKTTRRLRGVRVLDVSSLNGSRPHLSRERQSGNRLEVDDLAGGNHARQFVVCERLRFDILVLVLLGVLIVSWLPQAGGAKEVHQFITVARRRIKGAE